MHAGTTSRYELKISAFKKIHAEFKDIMKHEKCRACACFYGDVLNGVYEKIKSFRPAESDPSLLEIKHDFEHWVQDADFLKTHG
jgi:hypothetical protein